MHVLVVEDDRRMATLLDRGLGEEGYRVAVAGNGIDGLATALACDFDAIILDVMLPGIDGLEVVRRLRRQGRRTPVLMLTARDSCANIVQGLDVGADDYLTKPFSFDVFLARLRAVARRGPVSHPVILEAGSVKLNTATREARFDRVPVSLTRTEYAILELLLRRRGQVVTRASIVEEVWGFNSEVENNTLDAFIKLLRSKIDPGPRHRILHTVRGVGYMLRAED